MKSSTDSGHAVHLSERSDVGMIIVHQVVGMAKADSALRRDSPLRVSR
jgi:DNA-binding IclR family transcriptional regulator